MDANKFMTEYQRMCTTYERCADCPLSTDRPCAEIPSRYTKEFAAKLIKAVEAWSAAHPRKMRQDVFLEQYPEASCVDNILMSCPKVIDKNFSCSNTCFNCAECRREFWMQEVE